MASILVTGSRGLIGRSLVAKLAWRGFRPVGFDWSYPPAHPFYGDILDPTAIETAIRSCDGIVHLAAISRVGWGERDPDLCRQVNVEGTQRLLDAALARPRPPWFLLASSREVYGEPQSLPVLETAALAPENHYGHSKLAAEQVLAAKSDHIRHAVLRFANVYGSVHDHLDRVVPAFIARALRGEPLQVRGADNAFDFTHVNDVVAGIAATIDRLQSGAMFLPPVHFATGIGTSLGELAKLVVETTGSASQLDLQPSAEGFVSNFIGDPTRARESLGFRCEIALADGLRQLAVDMADPGDGKHAVFPDWHWASSR